MDYEQNQSRSIQERATLAKASAMVGSPVACRAVRKPWQVGIGHCTRRRSYGKRNPILAEEARNKGANDARGAGLQALGSVWSRQSDVEQTGGTQPELERRSYCGEAGVLRERGMACCVCCRLETGQCSVLSMPLESRRIAGHADAHSPHRAVCRGGFASGHQQPCASLRSLPSVCPLKKERES